MQTLWKAQTQMIVTSAAAFNDASLPDWDHVTHVGPVPDNKAPNAAMVEKIGTALVLPGDAEAAALKTAAALILKDPSFKSRAKVHAKTVHHLDVASAVADTMEAVVPEKPAAPVS